MNEVSSHSPDQIARLQLRLERERKARVEAEATAERGLRSLFERQRELELMQAVATAANEAVTTEAALHVTLKLLCEFTGWPVGHALVPSQTTTELVSTGLWYLQDEDRFADFRAATLRSQFAPGKGLPGRVWRAGNAVWVVDATKDGNFARADVALRVGLRGAFAFPVLVGPEVCAVIELFARTAVEPDESLMAIVTQIGTQLGRVFERAWAGEAIEKAREQLEERVRLRTVELDRANLQIAASERRYRQVLYNLREVVFQTDQNGAWTFLNPAWTEISGYTMEESLGRCYADFLHPDDLETGLKMFPPLIQGKTDSCRLEVRFITRGTGICWVELHARPLRNEAGECIGAAGTLADVTDRHEAELALKLRDRAMAATSNGIVISDARQPDMPIVFCNPAFERITGFTAEEAIGRNCRFLQGPETDQATLEILRRALREGTECRVVLRNYRKDRSLFWNELTISPIRDASGRLTHFVGAQSDISDRKRIEEEVRAANDKLARASRLKDEFLAAMSHELRTPLNAVLGFSEVLIDGVHGPVNEKQMRAIRNIQDSGRHLLSLINDILDLSKIEAGKERLMVDTVYLDVLCDASLQFVRPLAAKKNLRLSLALDPAIATVRGDERRLRQILANLLTNAVKFTPDGGQVGLEVKPCPESEGVCFTVWDTGIGISPEDQAKLFQPFVQLDSKLSRQYSGTGLGLSLVLRLAEMHGGRVRLESTPGQGSRFTVSIPRQQVEAQLVPAAEITARAQPVAAAPAPGASASRPLVLLAEDSPMNRETIVTYLTAKGFCVVTAENGEEAIRQAKAVHPAIILMDIQMPGMDGLEAMSILKSRPETARTPIIALTALAMSGDRERCLAAGADDYMAKPVNLRELTATLQRHIEPPRT